MDSLYYRITRPNVETMKTKNGLPSTTEIESLDLFLRDRRTVVVSGAGCSTESGIPDYRGAEGRFRERPPMRFGEFMASEKARRRYWARSFVGWPRFSLARPNPAHHALSRLEDMGMVTGVITQNVDGLHQEGGARSVVELHGNLSRVRCLDCGKTESRETVQGRLARANVNPIRKSMTLAPDGDAEASPELVRAFVIPSCIDCEGILKPDVVFFGESVPSARVDEAWKLFGTADALLVVGSSLSVYSGRRFVNRARERDIPIAIVNLGSTRADAMAEVKVEGSLGTVLPRLVDRLEGCRTSDWPEDTSTKEPGGE